MGATSTATIDKGVVYTEISDPELQSLMQDLGYRAELLADSSGDPQIRMAMNGFTVNIYTYGYTLDNCKTLLFRLGFDLTDGTSLKAVNDYNRTKIWGRVWMDDESDSWLEMAHDFA